MGTKGKVFSPEALKTAEQISGELAEVLKLSDRLETTIKISEEGVYDDLSHTVYHNDPVPGRSLSHSGARRLLQPSCPALFKFWHDHPNGDPDNVEAYPKTNNHATFELGVAAHNKLLGSGPDLVEVYADDWRSKYAQQTAMEIRSGGGVPLLTKEIEQIDAMIIALRAHPRARKIFELPGKCEQSIFWQDAETRVWRRGRTDFMTEVLANGKILIVDYKTAYQAHPRSFAKKADDYGYPMQTAWYLDGVQQITGKEAMFVFVIQEKHPPYLVSVVDLHPAFIARGRRLNRQALDIYAQCVRTDNWPGFTDHEIEQVEAPPWIMRQEEEYI